MQTSPLDRSRDRWFMVVYVCVPVCIMVSGICYFKLLGWIRYAWRLVQTCMHSGNPMHVTDGSCACSMGVEWACRWPWVGSLYRGAWFDWSARGTWRARWSRLIHRSEISFLVWIFLSLSLWKWHCISWGIYTGPSLLTYLHGLLTW